MVLTAAVGLLDALSDPLWWSDRRSVTNQGDLDISGSFTRNRKYQKIIFKNPNYTNTLYDLIQWIRFALCIDIDEIICNQKDQCSRHDSRKEANLHLRLLLHPHSSMLFLLRLPFRFVFSPIHTLDMERLNFGGPALEKSFIHATWHGMYSNLDFTSHCAAKEYLVHELVDFSDTWFAAKQVWQYRLRRQERRGQS